MRTLVAFLLLSSIALADSLVFVTQDSCPPCKVAKELLTTFDLQGLELKEVPLRDAKQYYVTRTPALVLIDNAGKFVASVSTVDKAHVAHLIGLAEVEAIQSLQLPDFVEEPKTFSAIPFGATPRIIRYTISTEYRNGSYNGSFTWGQVDHALSLLERYWNVDFVRVNSGGSLRIIQANTNPNSTWAAWTRGTDIRISPVYNFQGNRTTCEMVICHEFGHAAGGGSHDSAPGTLMHANGGALIAESSYRWFRAYQWKGALRPHQEPNFAIEYWRGNVVRGTQDQEELLSLKCGH